jgi:ubiquinone/menaquinone biosynthesis C-methylase UbiE
MTELFDAWPEQYDLWFQTPIGRLVKKCESELILNLLRPLPGEKIADAGCGTAVFTRDFLDAGSEVVGLDLSLPMLQRAKSKGPARLRVLQGDMLRLPFREASFDKAVSITAIEFIEDGRQAIRELFRVTRPKGIVVVATLNSLSSWAVRRKAKAREGHSLFSRAIFRSPGELNSLGPFAGTLQTAVHFQRGEDPQRARAIEEAGRKGNLETGAFLAVRWQKI